MTIPDISPKAGRPTKLTPNVVAAIKAVLSDEDYVLACTDEDLVFLVNFELEPEERISYRTFQRYKTASMHIQSFEGGDELNPPMEELCGHIKKAFIDLKVSLFKAIRNAKNTADWRRYSWILERKFREWRMPMKHPDLSSYYV